MPRLSAEERAALAYRTGFKLPPHPRHLSAPARHLWRAILQSRSTDYFDPSGLAQLGLYCEALVQCERLSTKLAETAPETPISSQLSKDLKTLTTIVAAHGRALRLTMQARVNRKDGILDEIRRPVAVVDDRLLGGGRP
jgi:hypothetical protein